MRNGYATVISSFSSLFAASLMDPEKRIHLIFFDNIEEVIVQLGAVLRLPVIISLVYRYDESLVCSFEEADQSSGLSFHNVRFGSVSLGACA